MLYVIQGLLQEYPPETYRVLRAVTYSTAVTLRAHSKATAWTAVRSGRKLLGPVLTAGSPDCNKSRDPAKHWRPEIARYCKVSQNVAYRGQARIDRIRNMQRRLAGRLGEQQQVIGIFTDFSFMTRSCT